MKIRLDWPGWLPGATVACLLLLVAAASWWFTGSRGGGRQDGVSAAEAGEIAATRTHSAPDNRPQRVNKGVRLSALATGGGVVRLAPGAVLATINGTPVLTGHLTPPQPGGGKMAMKRGIFRSRLRRAIEAELVIQAAAAAGVGLTEGQQRRLDGIAIKHAAELEALKPEGVTWDTVSTEQIDLERHLKEAMMLRQNLVAVEAGVAPSTQREKQLEYEGALNTMMAELEAAAQIEMVPRGSSD
jgi:hypothetical protein